MSEEIICLSSSDDEDPCIENSTNVQTKFNNATQKRRLSDLSFEDKNEVKKQKINNGVIDIDEYDEDSKCKSKLNLINKKVTFESTFTKSGNKSARKRSPSPIAGTSKYFDLIENPIPKKSAYDRKEEKLPSLSPQSSKASKKVSHNDSKEKQTIPISEKLMKRVKPQLIVKEIVPIPDPAEDIFEKILKTCRKKNKGGDIELVLQKLKKYYDELALSDKDCEEFRLFLNSYLNKMLNSNQFFKYLVDIKMEMIRRIKKNRKADTEQTDQDNGSTETDEIELTEEEAIKVKKLEEVIKRCKKRIEKLENQEVDFDEEDNSAYIMVDRYKKKLVELCAELTRITNDKMLKKQIHKRLLKRKDIPDEMTGIIYVDDAIIRFINSSIKQANELKHIKNPNAVAAYLVMPDYVDILQCIKQCNEERNLELKNKKMEKLAEKAFKAVGNYLKNQRLQETKNYLASFVENSEGDPAKNNQDLSKKLKNNKEAGMKKLEGIFAKYVAKQEGLSSEGSASENEENDSCEDESNEDDNSTNKNEDNSSSSNEDNAPNGDEVNSLKNDKSSVSKKRVIPRISSDDDDESQEQIENKETCKKSNESDTNEVNKENFDKEKSSTLEETFSTNKLTNSTDTAIRISKKNQINEKIQSSKTINEAVTILSEICEVSNSLTSDENKLCCESVEDEIEILSDNSDTNKENNKTLKNDSSQDIILEIEDDDPLSITEDNAKEGSVDNSLSTSDVNCPLEEKKRKIEEEKFSDEIQNKRITASKNSDEINISEKDLKDDTDNSSKIGNENSNKILKKMNVGKFYPLQARDNHEKLVSESDLSIITEDSKKEGNRNIIICDTSNTSEYDYEVPNYDVKETHISSNKKVNSANEILDITKESSFLKVKSFAKPPESWKDMSPEKPPKNQKLSIQQPIKQVLQQMSKPECVDLTNENEIRSSSSTRFINPLALKKRRVPVNKLVVVKNVVNNINFSLPADGVRERNRTVPLNKVQLVTPQVKSILIPKASCVQVNQVPPNNHYQRSNEISASIVRTPFVTLPSTKKKNDNSNSPSTVK